MHTVQVNGLELAFESFGDETGEALVLIAGLGSQMIRWPAPLCRALAARGYRVIRFDNRDAGCSTHFTNQGVPDFRSLVALHRAGRRPVVPYTLDDMAEDARGLLDGLSIGRAHLVGQSMGGMIAQLLACEHPERVLSLTSIMSSTGNPELAQAAPDVMTMMTSPAPDPLEDEAGFIAHGLAFARRIAGTGYPFEEQRYRALIREELRRAYDPGGFARQIAALAATGDLRPRLARITAPTLVIHGADDPLVPPQCGADTASSIPGAEFMLVEGMGHELVPAHYPTVTEAIDRTARCAATVIRVRTLRAGHEGKRRSR